MPTRLIWRIPAFIALSVLFFVLLRWADPESDHSSGTVHLGEWTNPQGPPGNRIHFWLQESSTRLTWGKLLEGRVRVENLLGRTADGDWNYGDHKPLMLNLNFPDGPEFLVIEPAGPDALRLRAAPDAQRLLGDRPLDHPDTIRLERISPAAPK